ncbi:UNVERIFIED_CONTAM: hypothetical protein O1L33_28750, partial [Pseudomonas aeruginosa]
PKSALSAACATCDDLRPSKRPNAQGCEKCGLALFWARVTICRESERQRRERLAFPWLGSS